MDPWRILKYPYTTEKTISLAERENKIVFVVDRKADKPKIKEAFEKAFEVKVAKVNTQISIRGEKKAYIKLKPEFKAADVAVKLGII
jgi:large subunit ribosomal protein L23